MELETQRKNRYKDLGLKKIKESDFHIIRRILFLFDRICYKFKYNVKIRVGVVFFKKNTRVLILQKNTFDFKIKKY